MMSVTDTADLFDHGLPAWKELDDMGAWVEYAQLAGSQKNFARARWAWGRALALDRRSQWLWLTYAEAEMRNKFFDHARNVWDRAVTAMPGADQLWREYAGMEERLGNVAGARRVFERWTGWDPDARGWLRYAAFERRHGEAARARSVFERLLVCHPSAVEAWIEFARFEAESGEHERALAVFSRASKELAGVGADERGRLVWAQAEYEERRRREIERARAVHLFTVVLYGVVSSIVYYGYTCF